MAFGAATVAARDGGAREIIDPRSAAQGSIAEAYRQHPHMGAVLPALGYSEAQRADLRETILAAAPELVVDGSPAGVIQTLGLDVRCVRARYAAHIVSGPSLAAIVDARLESLRNGRSR
jgi:predicted GTPase